MKLKPIAAALAVAASAATAAPPPVPPGHGRGHGEPPPFHFDDRHHHGLYYPSVGYGMTVLPTGSIGIVYAGGHWYFQGGVWFRPVGGRYVVAMPPVGIVVPYLPPSYVTLWIGGAPYYYANGVYYAGAAGGYAVVAAPPGAATAPAVPVPAPQPVAPIVYPRQGQSAAQIQADHAACQKWADAQPGARTDPGVYQRGFAACMDGRGYTVR